MIDDHAAVVSDPGLDRNFVVETSYPVQGRTVDGGMAPTNLTIQDTSTGFSPASTPSPIAIGQTVSDGVAFENGGFSVEATSSRTPDPLTDASTVFFGNIATDSDVLVRPTTFGATVDFMLRSVASPEQATLHVNLPPGAQLVHTHVDHPFPNDPPTSVEVELNGRALGYIYAPFAYDADGVVVPTHMVLDGNDILIEVPHRSLSVRYPITVDPDIGQTGAYPGYDDTNYNGGATNWPGWREYVGNLSAGCAAGYNTTPGYAVDWSAYAPGMYVSFPTNSCFGPNAYVETAWTAPVNTYIDRVTFGNFAHQPFYSGGFGGVYTSAMGWASGVTYQAGTNGNPFTSSSAYSGLTGTSCYWSSGSCTDGQGYEVAGNTSSAVFGLQVKNPYNGPIYTTGSIARATASSITAYVGDRHAPTISASPAGSSWSNQQTFSLPVTLNDQGLGVKSVTLSGAATGGGTITNTCTGDVNRSPCPLSGATSYTYTLPEGISNLTLQGADIVGNPAAAVTWTQKIDVTAPSVNVSGALWDARNGTLGTGNVRINADAFDGDEDSGTTSGITRLEFKVDGVDPNTSVDRIDQSCPAGDCDQSAEFMFDTGTLTTGTHQFEVDATDQAGNTTSSTWTVAISSSAIPPDSSATAAASTPRSSMNASVGQAVDSLQAAAGSVLGSVQSVSDATLVPSIIAPALSLDPSHPTVYQSLNSAVQTEIPADASSGMSLDTNWGPLQITPIGVASGAQPAAIVNGAAAVYANTAASADTIIRPTALGASVDTQIRDITSPDTYSWQLSLADNESLRQLSDGSVAIYGYITSADASMTPGSASTDAANTASASSTSDGEPGAQTDLGAAPTWTGTYASSSTPAAAPNASTSLAHLSDTSAQIADGATALSQAGTAFDGTTQFLLAVIRAPWAVDAHGVSVPVALSVTNNIVTMTVAHHAGIYAYPIVADPEWVSCQQKNPCGSYNRSAAVAYAVHWRKTFNPAYLKFDGDDCTNYVSQIFHAGGGQMLRRYQHGKGSWWMHKFGVYDYYWDWSHSWSVSSDFVHQQLEFGLAQRVRGAYLPGDMVAWDWQWKSHPGINHMDFVAQVDSSGHAYFLQHSREYDSPFSFAAFKARATDGGDAPMRFYHLRFVHTAANIP